MRLQGVWEGLDKQTAGEKKVAWALEWIGEQGCGQRVMDGNTYNEVISASEKLPAESRVALSRCSVVQAVSSSWTVWGGAWGVWGSAVRSWGLPRGEATR